MCLMYVFPYDQVEIKNETDMDEKNKHLKMPSPLCPSQPLSITNLTPTMPRTQAELAVEQACPENEELPPLNRTEPLIVPSGPLCQTTLPSAPSLAMCSC